MTLRGRLSLTIGASAELLVAALAVLTAAVPGALAASPAVAHAAPAPPAAAPTAQPPAVPAAVQSPPTLDQALAAETAPRGAFGGVALAPDGRRIAWVEAPRGQESEANAAVWVADLAAGGAPGPARRLDAATGGAASPAWSPDGRRLAFLAPAALPPAERHGGHGAGRGGAGAAADSMGRLAQREIWVADLSGGGARQLTHGLHGQLSDPLWSPDGRALAVLWIAGRATSAAPTAALPRDAGAVGETPAEQRIAVVDLQGDGALHEVTPPDLFVYEFDWSPDGTALAGVAAHGAGDANWWDAQLYRFNRAGGSAQPLLKPDFQMANPRWSPDGKSIALIGGLMSDQGVTGGDVYVVSAGGGPARDLTAGRPASANWLGWTSDGSLLVLEFIAGGMGLTRLEPAGDLATPLWRRDATFSAPQGSFGLAVSRDGSMGAAIESSFAHPPEIWAGAMPAAAGAAMPAGSRAAVPTGSGDGPPAPGWHRLTHRHDGVSPAWGEAISLLWASDLAQGAQAQGWLLAPPAGSVAPGQRAPMVVLVHGGPSSVHHAAWPRTAGVLASQGFYVLMPNPRGSYGLGEAFTRGNVKDFGYGDLRDIMAGVDKALAAAPIDPQRLAIDGWSYGGYMTMWAVTQTDRFHAAVAGAGVANWLSYYGENRIDRWMIPFFGASVYDDPWIYERSAPMTFIKAVHTPTLVLQGERDAEVPAPQSYEFWHALRTLGVETRLVIYPDEGHHMNTADTRDALARSVDWLRTHLR